MLIVTHKTSVLLPSTPEIRSSTKTTFGPTLRPPAVFVQSFAKGGQETAPQQPEGHRQCPWREGSGEGKCLLHGVQHRGEKLPLTTRQVGRSIGNRVSSAHRSSGVLHTLRHETCESGSRAPVLRKIAPRSAHMHRRPLSAVVRRQIRSNFPESRLPAWPSEHPRLRCLEFRECLRFPAQPRPKRGHAGRGVHRAGGVEAQAASRHEASADTPRLAPHGAAERPPADAPALVRIAIETLARRAAEPGVERRRRRALPHPCLQCVP